MSDVLHLPWSDGSGFVLVFLSGVLLESMCPFRPIFTQAKDFYTTILGGRVTPGVPGTLGTPNRCAIALRCARCSSSLSLSFGSPVLHKKLRRRNLVPAVSNSCSPANPPACSPACLPAWPAACSVVITFGPNEGTAVELVELPKGTVRQCPAPPPSVILQPFISLGSLLVPRPPLSTLAHRNGRSGHSLISLRHLNPLHPSLPQRLEHKLASGRFATETEDGAPAALGAHVKAAGQGTILHGPVKLQPHNEEVVIVQDLDGHEYCFVDARGYRNCIGVRERSDGTLVDWCGSGIGLLRTLEAHRHACRFSR